MEGDFDSIQMLLNSLQGKVDELKKDKADLESAVHNLKNSNQTIRDVSIIPLQIEITVVFIVLSTDLQKDARMEFYDAQNE